jgi:putative Mn2+ efflux pump MntP
MKKLEIILIAGAAAGLLLALFNVPLNSLIVSLFFVGLGLLYFYLGFALLNGIRFRNIFKADSYKGLGPWRIAIAIGTGIALSNITIGFMFSILGYPMAETLLTFGIVLTVIMTILALIEKARDRNPFYRNIIIRCIVFLVLAVIFLLIPGHIFEKT